MRLRDWLVWIPMIWILFWWYLILILGLILTSLALAFLYIGHLVWYRRWPEIFDAEAMIKEETEHS